MPELIARISTTLEPRLTTITTTFGHQSQFEVPAKYGVEIVLAPHSMASNVGVDINEIIHFKTTGRIMLHLNTFPHMANPNFVIAWGSIPNLNGMQGIGFTNKDAIMANEDLKQRYNVESVQKLTVVEGTDLRFVIGKKAEGAEVFVDGWMKEAQSPSWRVHLPLEDENFVIPDARLLIFT